jgi:hypothetical protein
MPRFAGMILISMLCSFAMDAGSAAAYSSLHFELGALLDVSIRMVSSARAGSGASIFASADCDESVLHR